MKIRVRFIASENVENKQSLMAFQNRAEQHTICFI